MEVLKSYDKKILYNCSIGYLIQNVYFPEFQRIEDQEHTKTIFESLRMEYERNQSFLIPGHISIAVMANVGLPYALLDGQHRVCALKMLSKKFPDILENDISVTGYICSSSIECQEIYNKLNSTKPVELYLSYDVSIITNGVLRHIKEKYNKYIKHSNRPRIPNINPDNIENEFKRHNLVKRMNVKSSEELIACIEELNGYYKACSWETLQEYGIDSSKMNEYMKDKENTLYFGLYQNYEWIERIIYHKQNGISYDKMNHSVMSNTRQKITHKLRHDVWSKRNQTNSMDGFCFVCGENLRFDEFECSHIIPVCCGGNSEIDNLEPCCRKCNQDMGTMNLTEYKLLIDGGTSLVVQ
jgi:5-methylcytosine-specific restriction endonuclease McrA